MKLAALLVLAALVAPPAIADEGGFYAGAAAGLAKLGGDGLDEFMANENMAPVTDVDDADFGFKIYGGYRFTPQFSAELGYSKLGTYTFETGTPSTGEASADSLDVSALAHFPVGNRFAFFGRFGVGIWDIKVRLAGPPGSANDRKNKTSISPLIGLGLTYGITERIALRAEVERHFAVGAKENTGEFDIDLATVGVQWDF